MLECITSLKCRKETHVNEGLERAVRLSKCNVTSTVVLGNLHCIEPLKCFEK